jgi:Trk K+ transport system NAD-binding subunit
VSGDTDLTPNDVVVAVVPRDHADELRETFLPERP